MVDSEDRYSTETASSVQSSILYDCDAEALSVEVLKLDTPPRSPKNSPEAREGSTRVEFIPDQYQGRLFPSGDQSSPVKSSRPLGFGQVFSDQAAAYQHRTLALVTTLPALSSDSLQQRNIDFNLDCYGFPDERRRDFRSSPSKIHTHTLKTGPTSESQPIPSCLFWVSLVLDPCKQAFTIFLYLNEQSSSFVVSDSDEDKTASSMDSTTLTSPPVDSVDDDSSTQLPTRLFAPGFFPTALRLNIYSKANVIGAVASAQAGSADMEVLLGSQFGRLFHLPAARCLNSTKLIGSLLCRQLITTRKYELWYTFATHPLYFSLDKFHSITGLNCGAFNVEDSDSEETAGSIMWQKRFDTKVGDITVAKVLEMLRNPFLASWK
ncbi:hypothetical protein F2Q70_00011444 [Brassica cretica]|uniref:DUF1985 domain-containing protein n=1 Tax=Brassica cretica TaxID=69181 RepID=A0A8S9M0G0_BRACR|nr:hypothetical protein F2Q70_00011444 [Brassica cretica]